MESGDGGVPPQTARENIGALVRLLRRCLRFKGRALVAFLAVAAVGVPLAFSAQRRFRSETIILYQESFRSLEVNGSEGSNDTVRRVGARLREVLLSRASLTPIIKELHLYTKPNADAADLVDAVDEMRKHITFKAREGDTFEIAFEAAAPEVAQQGTTRLADAIVQEAASRRSEQAKTLKEFLDLESEKNEADLKTKESALARFLATHAEFALPTPTEVHSPHGSESLSPSRGSGSSSPQSPDEVALAALNWKAHRLEQQLRTSDDHTAPPPAPLKSAVVLPESAELVAARKDVEDKLARFTEKHPDAIEARRRLRAAELVQARAQAEADAQHAAALAAALEAPPPKPANEDEREALKLQLSRLQRQIASRRSAAAIDPPPAPSTAPNVVTSPEAHPSVVLEVEYRRLEREVSEARDRQRQLDERQFRASIAASSVMNDRNIQVSILDPPFFPTHPISRSRRVLLSGALLIAFLVAGATALVSARFDDRIFEPNDLADMSLVPVLGVVPRLALAAKPLQKSRLPNEGT